MRRLIAPFTLGLLPPLAAQTLAGLFLWQEVLQERVKAGELLSEQAEVLIDRIAQVTMGGGLGVLMSDLVPGIAENGGETVSVQVLYQRLRDTHLLDAGDYIREAFRRMGYQ